MAPPKPTRRTSSQAAQSTLSFHTGNSKTSKTASPASATLDAKNRVSKPISTAARSTLASAAGKKPLANLPIVAPAAQPVVEIAAPEAEPEAIVEEETEEEEEDEETTRARRVSQAQIAQYWAAREAERTAPRVHQKALTVREKVLREFDMSSRYGPSIGIPRVKRWRRAHMLHMAPPIEVLAVLVHEDDEGHAVRAARSIMDELMDAKIGPGVGV